MRTQFGNATEALDNIRDLGGNNGSSFIDKDLRTLLGREVQGPFNLQYCGDGDLDNCRKTLWAVVDSVASTLAIQFGNDDPATWLNEGRLIGFNPEVASPGKFRATNRPTFQQVLEFAPTRPEGL